MPRSAVFILTFLFLGAYDPDLTNTIKILIQETPPPLREIFTAIYQISTLAAYLGVLLRIPLSLVAIGNAFKSTKRAWWGRFVACGVAVAGVVWALSPLLDG